MKTDQDPPVLIVGAGPTGLMLAISLARSGVPFRLIDKARGRSLNSRALILQSRTLELLDGFGLIDEFQSRGHSLLHMEFHHHGKKVGQVDFDRLESRYPESIILPQTDTEALLEAELERLGGRVERPAELLELAPRPHGTLAKVKDSEGVIRQILFRYVAACDGAHSTVRQSLGIPFPGETYPEIFALADIRLDGNLPRHAGKLYFHEEGFVFLAPIRPVCPTNPAENSEAGLWRVITRLHGDAARDGIDYAELQEILTHRTGETFSFGAVEWLTSFRSHHRRATRFQLGRTFLLGDAAHIHSPAGGQGMNTGLQDAINLGWKLALVLQDKAPESLLDSYEAERLPVADHVLATTDRMLRLAEITSPPVANLRDRLLSLITGLPPIENALARDLSQLSVHYRLGPLTTEKRWRFTTRAQMRAGERLPDFEITLPNGTRSRIYEHVRGPSFHLFVAPLHHRLYGEGSYGQARHLVEGLQADFGNNLQVHWILTPAQSIALRAELPEHFVDLGGVATQALGLLPCGVALLRPDYYCAYAEAGFDLGNLRLSSLVFWIQAK